MGIFFGLIAAFWIQADCKQSLSSALDFILSSEDNAKKSICAQEVLSIQKKPVFQNEFGSLSSFRKENILVLLQKIAAKKTIDQIGVNQMKTVSSYLKEFFKTSEKKDKQDNKFPPLKEWVLLKEQESCLKTFTGSYVLASMRTPKGLATKRAQACARKISDLLAQPPKKGNEGASFVQTYNDLAHMTFSWRADKNIFLKDILSYAIKKIQKGTGLTEAERKDLLEILYGLKKSYHHASLGDKGHTIVRESKQPVKRG